MDDSPLLNAANKKKVQEVLGTLLFYVRAINNIMLPALNTITAAQATSTQKTLEAITKLLNYCASHPNVVVCFHASDMILWTNRNALYPMEVVKVISNIYAI